LVTQVIALEDLVEYDLAVQHSYPLLTSSIEKRLFTIQPTHYREAI